MNFEELNSKFSEINDAISYFKTMQNDMTVKVNIIIN